MPGQTPAREAPPRRAAWRGDPPRSASAALPDVGSQASPARAAQAPTAPRVVLPGALALAPAARSPAPRGRSGRAVPAPQRAAGRAARRQCGAKRGADPGAAAGPDAAGAASRSARRAARGATPRRGPAPRRGAAPLPPGRRDRRTPGPGSSGRPAPGARGRWPPGRPVPRRGPSPQLEVGAAEGQLRRRVPGHLASRRRWRRSARTLARSAAAAHPAPRRSPARRARWAWFQRWASARRSPRSGQARAGRGRRGGRRRGAAAAAMGAGTGSRDSTAGAGAAGAPREDRRGGARHPRAGTTEG